MAGNYLNKWHDEIINAASRVTIDMVEASMDLVCSWYRCVNFNQKYQNLLQRK